MCRLIRGYIVDKSLLMRQQAMEHWGYFLIMLDFQLRDWLKKALPNGEMMTKMDITCLRLGKI